MEEMPGAIYSGATVLQEIVLERVSWQQKSKEEAGGVGGGGRVGYPRMYTV